jgi:hypothetical protein
MRIHRFDQVNLLAATPSLDFFLATDRCIGIDEFFVIDQARQVVSAGESRNKFVLVLEDAMRQVAGDASVENMGAGTVGHDVDEEASGFSHLLLVSSKGVIPTVAGFQAEGGIWPAALLLCIAEEPCLSVTIEQPEPVDFVEKRLRCTQDPSAREAERGLSG